MTFEPALIMLFRGSELAFAIERSSLDPRVNWQGSPGLPPFREQTKNVHAKQNFYSRQPDVPSLVLSRLMELLLQTKIYLYISWG